MKGGKGGTSCCMNAVCTIFELSRSPRRRTHYTLRDTPVHLARAERHGVFFTCISLPPKSMSSTSTDLLLQIGGASTAIRKTLSSIVDSRIDGNASVALVFGCTLVYAVGRKRRDVHCLVMGSSPLLCRLDFDHRLLVGDSCLHSYDVQNTSIERTLLMFDNQSATLY